MSATGRRPIGAKEREGGRVALLEHERDGGGHGMPHLFDVEGVAAYMATSTRHVRRLVQDRRIPFLKVGGLLRFRRVDVDAWLDEHRVHPDWS